MRVFPLVLRYVLYNRLKSAILVASIFLTAFLPVSIKMLLDQFNTQLTARARLTPLLVGAPGSQLDLTLHALYFKTRTPGTLEYGRVAEIRKTGWGQAIPLYATHTAHQFPVVGTSLDYFDYRQLKIAQGTSLAFLGDCVLGAQVAQRLNLEPGDKLITDRENVVDIAGKYPLKMHVRGVLEPTRTADDWAVFVDLKTAWVIDGLGHGHQDIETVTDDGLVAGRTDGVIVARASVLPYLEITPENAGSFHFHGEPDQFPLTAILVVPPDTESETKLLGRYQNADSAMQMVIPAQVIDELMSMIFQVKRFFDANAILISVATGILLVLVILLSIRLRRGEMETLFKLGCRRGTMATLILGELMLIFLAAGAFLFLAAWGVHTIGRQLVQTLLMG